MSHTVFKAVKLLYVSWASDEVSVGLEAYRAYGKSTMLSHRVRWSLTQSLLQSRLLGNSEL